MPDERYPRYESDTDIDSEHREDLSCYRMTSRIEIDPEIWEECHTPSWYPDSETLWSKYEESNSNKESRRDKKPSIAVSWHTSLYLRSCCIEEVAIREEMDDASMQELE